MSTQEQVSSLSTLGAKHKVAIGLRLLNLTQLFSQAPLPYSASFLAVAKASGFFSHRWDKTHGFTQDLHGCCLLFCFCCFFRQSKQRWKRWERLEKKHQPNLSEWHMTSGRNKKTLWRAPLLPLRSIGVKLSCAKDRRAKLWVYWKSMSQIGFHWFYKTWYFCTTLHASQRDIYYTKRCETYFFIAVWTWLRFGIMTFSKAFQSTAKFLILQPLRTLLFFLHSKKVCTKKKMLQGSARKALQIGSTSNFLGS